METRKEEEFARRSVVITGAAGGIGIGFTRSLPKVVGEHGITVNAVTPGLTVTAPIKKLFLADALAQATQSLALKRKTSSAQFTPWPRRTRFITGQIINVDGGAEFH